MSLKTASRSVLCITFGVLSACNEKKQADTPVAAVSSLQVPKIYLRSADPAAVLDSFPDSFYDKLKVSKVKPEVPAGIIIAVYATHANSLKDEKNSSVEREIRASSALQSLAVEATLKILPDELVSFHPEAIGHERHLKDISSVIREIEIYRASLKVLNAAYYTAPDTPKADYHKALNQEANGRSELDKLEKDLYRELGDAARVVMQRDIPIRQASNVELVHKTLDLLKNGQTLSDNELKALVLERDRQTVEMLQADPERPYRIVTLGKSHDLRPAVLEWNRNNPDRQCGLLEIRCESRDFQDVVQAMIKTKVK